MGLNCDGLQADQERQLKKSSPGEISHPFAICSMAACKQTDRARGSPRREKGKEEASPIEELARGKSSLVGPVSMLEVATVNITFSPITFGEPNTQKTSASIFVRREGLCIAAWALPLPNPGLGYALLLRNCHCKLARLAGDHDHHIRYGLQA